MSKRNFIILGVIIFLILAGNIFFTYQQKAANQNIILTPDKLLASFEVKNISLTPEAAQLFRQRFEDLKKNLQADSDSFGDWLYLGVLKKGAGDYEGARDVFLFAAKIRPQASTPFVNLADLYGYFLNDPVKAEESIKQAIANDPMEYNFYLSLADIYRYKFPARQGMYERTLLEAIAKFPDNANLIAPLAAYYRDTDQIQKAIERYEQLVKLLPDNKEAKQDLAELKAKK